MRRIYTGIDIGTKDVKVVIAASPENSELPMQIVATGSAPSRGIRNGYVVEGAEAAKAVREALARAQSAAKVKVRSARVAMGGVGLEEIRSTGEITLTPSGGVVTEREIDRALRESEKRAAPKLANRSIIHTIPLEYRVDGSKVLGRAEGLQGTKLAVDTLLITMIAQHEDGIRDAVEASGVEVEDVMAAPLAASMVTLTKAQKMAGVALASIGAETLSLMVFDNDAPVSVKVFPAGSSDITNAIALAFQIPLTEAEQMKRGAVTGSDIAPKRMHGIVASKLKDMFSNINAHLKTLGRQRLLPAGIVLTGGGSALPGAAEVAKAVLKLPAQIGQIGYLPRTASIDPAFAVAYGLCRWGYIEDVSDSKRNLADVLRQAADSVRQGIRSLLP